MRVVMCDACITPTGKFKAAQAVDVQGAQMLSSGEYIVVTLTLIVMSMAVANEIRDIKLCEMTSRRYAGGGRLWNSSLTAIGNIRLYGVVIWTTFLYLSIVIHRGSDSFSLCMNTVAILFVLEIDNVMYAHGLSSKCIQEFESYHHAPILEKDHVLLERTKVLYFIAVPLYSLAALMLTQNVAEMVGAGSAIILPLNLLYPILIVSAEAAVGLLGGSNTCKAWCQQLLSIYCVQVLGAIIIVVGFGLG